MPFNYSSISWRRLTALPLYSVLNIGGLAVGIACFVLALLFVEDEMSFDRSWSKADRIYLVETSFSVNGGHQMRIERTHPQVAPLLSANVPSMSSVSRLARLAFLVSADEVRHYEGVSFVDSSMLDIFDFEFTAGSAKDALREPMTVVLTETYARKFFGAASPMNRYLMLDGKYPLRVTGVVKDLPRNTHLKMELISNVSSMQAMIYGEDLVQWRNPNVRTYVSFDDIGQIETVRASLATFVRANFPPELAARARLSLTEVGTLRQKQMEIGGINTLMVPLTIGVIVLLMACINTINLSTARGAERMKELGVRKVLGASRTKLALQFLAESMTLTFAALVLASLLIETSLPFLNPLFDKQLEFNLLNDVRLAIQLLLTTLATGLLSGAYPALMLSNFRAADVFRGNVHFGGGARSFRSVMVGIQFSMALVLSIATSFVYLQMDYVRKIKLGFNDANVVVLDNIGWTEIRPQFETLRNELLKNGNIRAASASMAVPGREFERVSDFKIADWNAVSKVSLSRLSIDHDFFKTYDVSIVAGRDFSRDYGADIVQPTADGAPTIFNVVINETAARRFGFASAQEAVGRLLVSSDRSWNFDGRIVGVVSDFHILAGHGSISPYVYLISPTYVQYASIKINGNQIGSTLKYIDETWNRVIPKYPIVRSFLRHDLQETFMRWERNGWMMVALSILSLLIAVLGCFALAAHSTKRRLREIGLRKVLGASSSRIVSLLTFEFSKPVIMANLIAWPIAYFAVRAWLEGYSYRIEMSGYVFLLNGLFSLILSSLVVSMLTLAAARMNPASVLRHE